MKIVHLTETYAPVVGGIERQVHRLATLQAAAGHDVVVVSGRAGAGPTDVVEYGVRVRRPRRPSPRLTLPVAVEDMDADVFHAHLSVLSPGTLRSASALHRTPRPLAVTVHSLWPAAAGASRAVVRLAGLDTERVAWSAVSGVARDRVLSALRAGREVSVVPNAVDTAWWHNPRPRRHPARVHAVLVGRLAARKRVLPFLRALVARWPERLDVTVVGEGSQQRRIESLLRRAGRERQCRLLATRPPAAVRELLHDADVFVAPAALESFGIAALEARSAGLPVLGRRGTGLADFLRDGVNGWLAAGDDELAAGLAALVAAPAQLEALRAGAAGPVKCGQHRCVHATDRLYARAVTALATPVGRPASVHDGPGPVRRVAATGTS